MRNRTSVVLLAIIALLSVLVAPSATQAKITKRAPGKHLRLKAFSSCDSLLAYARKNGPKVNGITAPPPRGAGGDVDSGAGTPTAAPAPAAPQPTAGEAAGGADSGKGAAGIDFSTTNVQEEGVDEPDIMKTDGDTIFSTTEYGSRIRATDVRGGGAKLAGAVDVEGTGVELLLSGNRLIAISRVYPNYYDHPGVVRPAAYRRASSMPYYSRPDTVLSEIDVSDPAKMAVTKTYRVEGSYVSARLVGRSIRIVLNTPARAVDYPHDPTPTTPQEAEANRRQHIASAPVNEWLPDGTATNKRTGQASTKLAVGCRKVRKTATFTGVDMLTVLTIDLNKGLEPVDSDAVMTDAQTVYATPGTLYVATQNYALSETAQPDTIPSSARTTIHKFDISAADTTTYKASGSVPGFVLNQFALSESKGILRVATTEVPTWFAGAEPVRESESFVTTMEERNGGLVTIGRADGLGRGERIFGVRFIGDTAFVVTFRQTDPLYTVDVSNPVDPKVLGELKILGYSAYLHPISSDLVLGVGQDADEAGRRKGTQLSLFDVSDLRAPKRVAQALTGQFSSSSAEYDHKAFLYWRPTDLAVIPISTYGQPSFQGAVGWTVDPATKTIKEAGRVAHDEAREERKPPPSTCEPSPDGQPVACPAPASPSFSYDPVISRAAVVGKRLFTLSPAGIKASGLSDLSDQAWVSFATVAK